MNLFVMNAGSIRKTSDWVIEGPRHIDRHSVISQNHYEELKNSNKICRVRKIRRKST